MSMTCIRHTPCYIINILKSGKSELRWPAWQWRGLPSSQKQTTHLGGFFVLYSSKQHQHPNPHPYLDQKQSQTQKKYNPRLPSRKAYFPLICIDFFDYVVYTHAIIFIIDNIKLFQRNY